MDTTGAPYGTRLRVLFQSPIPDGWVIVEPRRTFFAHVDHPTCMEIRNDPPPESMEVRLEPMPQPEPLVP
jgi:hypothetical protein